MKGIELDREKKKVAERSELIREVGEKKSLPEMKKEAENKEQRAQNKCNFVPRRVDMYKMKQLL